MATIVLDNYLVKKGKHHVISKSNAFQAAKSILYGTGTLSFSDFDTFEETDFPKAWKEVTKKTPKATEITKK